MIFAFHQLRIADEGRIQIARRMPKRSSRVRPAGRSRPSEIIAQGSGIIRVVLAQAGTRRGGAGGRDSKCAHSLNMCARGAPFALAGVCDMWKGDRGKTITSFAIVTPAAAPSVARYHNRMLVVLDDSHFTSGSAAPRPGRSADEALCRRSRGVGSRCRSRQRYLPKEAGVLGRSAPLNLL